jgi:hypothetical protein
MWIFVQGNFEKTLGQRSWNLHDSTSKFVKVIIPQGGLGPHMEIIAHMNIYGKSLKNLFPENHKVRKVEVINHRDSIGSQ